MYLIKCVHLPILHWYSHTVEVYLIPYSLHVTYIQHVIIVHVHNMQYIQGVVTLLRAVEPFVTRMKKLADNIYLDHFIDLKKGP